MGMTITAEEFEQLYRSTAPQLFAYLRRRTSIEVEDLVADVFVTAWRRRSELPTPDLRRAWLFGAARRVLLAECRRRRHQHEVVGQLLVEPDPGFDGDDQRNREVVAAALGRLRSDDRELIQLIEWERLSPAEVAVVLGIRPATARVRLYRARQALAADPELGALIERRAVPVESER